MKEATQSIPSFTEATGALNWALVIPTRVAGTLSYTVNGTQGRRYFFLSRGKEFVLEFGHDFAAFQAAALDILTSPARKTRSYAIVPRITRKNDELGILNAELEGAASPEGADHSPSTIQNSELPAEPAVDEAALERSRHALRRAQRKGQLMRMQAYDLQPLIGQHGLAIGRHAPHADIVAAILIAEFGVEGDPQIAQIHAEGAGEEGEGAAADSDGRRRGAELPTSNVQRPTSNDGGAGAGANQTPYTAESLGKMEWNALKAFAASKGVSAPKKADIINELLELLAPEPAGV